MDIDYIRARGAWSEDAEGQTEADRRSEERIAAAARVMLDLSPHELTSVLVAVGGERCLDCGGHDPRCHCENDE